jgi:hypothetical protein
LHYIEDEDDNNHDDEDDNDHDNVDDNIERSSSKSNRRRAKEEPQSKEG